MFNFLNIESTNTVRKRPRRSSAGKWTKAWGRKFTEKEMQMALSSIY